MLSRIGPKIEPCGTSYLSSYELKTDPILTR